MILIQFFSHYLSLYISSIYGRSKRKQNQVCDVDRLQKKPSFFIFIQLNFSVPWEYISFWTNYRIGMAFREWGVTFIRVDTRGPLTHKGQRYVTCWKTLPRPPLPLNPKIFRRLKVLNQIMIYTCTFYYTLCPFPTPHIPCNLPSCQNHSVDSSMHAGLLYHVPMRQNPNLFTPKNK